MNMKTLFAVSILAIIMSTSTPFAGEPVTVDNFVGAETDTYMARYVGQGAFGQWFHIRLPTPIDEQGVIRMNRDTLYSVGIFDLTSPVTIAKPDTGERFQSMLVISQDHFVVAVEHGAGDFTFTETEVDTRYVFVVFRTFVDSSSEADIAAANAIQDQITARQDDVGHFEIPDWDATSLGTVRNALNVLAGTLSDMSRAYGAQDEVNPIHHLVGAAYGWGGNPQRDALYVNQVPERNGGVVPHALTVRDVPVDGFWSITLYNANGFMEANDHDAYSFNGTTAMLNDDGSVTIHFGACEDGRVNCLPITEGWNYIVRLYRPRQEVLDGSWVFPEAEAVP